MITAVPTKLALSISAQDASLPMEEWSTFLADRAVCDDPQNVDPSKLQILPYVTIFREHLVEEEKGIYVLSYVRGKAGGEGRLHDKLSIGFGGHMETHVTSNIINTIVEETTRELQEELGYTPDYRLINAAVIKAVRAHRLIYLPDTEVGSVHLGLSVMLNYAADQTLDAPIRKTILEAVKASKLPGAEPYSDDMANKLIDQRFSLSNFTNEAGEIEGLAWVNLNTVTPEQHAQYEPWSHHLIAVYQAQMAQAQESSQAETTPAVEEAAI